MMKRPSDSRTNYSPVRRMNRTFQDEFSPTSSSSSSDRLNSNRSATNNLQENVTARDQIQGLDVDENVPEEVYVYDCCCVSKELNPSIKYMSTFKSLFFLFNFLVFAFGLANFGMGLWFRIDPKVYEIHKYIETQNFTIAGWIMLFAGFVSCIMSLVGFAAAGGENSKLLAFYFIIMIAITLAFVGNLVLLTVYGLGSSLEHFLVKEIYEQIRRRTMNTEFDSFISSEAAQFLDFIQVKLRCCGANDFRDYNKLGIIVPTTCYAIEKNYVIAPGCGRAIRQMLDLRAGLATGFSSGSILAQLLAIILSATMFCSIYHWRANPRPATPISNPANTVLGSTTRRDSPLHHLQRPRSRTPIVI